MTWRPEEPLVDWLLNVLGVHHIVRLGDVVHEQLLNFACLIFNDALIE
jgi:hypothetical protein